MGDLICPRNAQAMLAGRGTNLTSHIQELCDILGRGLVRLHGHIADELAREAKRGADPGESSLHIHANQSGYANRTAGGSHDRK